jgi:hypothetical protein
MRRVSAALALGLGLLLSLAIAAPAAASTGPSYTATIAGSGLSGYVTIRLNAAHTEGRLTWHLAGLSPRASVYVDVDGGTCAAHRGGIVLVHSWGFFRAGIGTRTVRLPSVSAHWFWYDWQHRGGASATIRIAGRSTCAIFPGARPTPTITAPPAPTNVTMDIASSGFGGTAHYTVSWHEAATAGVTMRVYGVSACLNAGALPPGASMVPCLVRGMRLPANVLSLVATAPAAAGRVSWTSPGFGDIGAALAEYGGKDFYAFVIGAYSAAGHSRMAIAATAQYCPDCTY